MLCLKWLCLSLARVGDQEGRVKKPTPSSKNAGGLFLFWVFFFFIFLPVLTKIITDEVSENQRLMKCKVRAEESFRSIRVIMGEDGLSRMT